MSYMTSWQRRYIRRILQLALFVQLAVDEMINAIEFIVLISLAPLSWMVHPLELALRVLQYYQTKKPPIVVHIFFKLMTHVWNYFSYLFARIRRIDREIDRLEETYRRKVEGMQSIHGDYNRRQESYTAKPIRMRYFKLRNSDRVDKVSRNGVPFSATSHRVYTSRSFLDHGYHRGSQRVRTRYQLRNRYQ